MAYKPAPIFWRRLLQWAATAWAISTIALGLYEIYALLTHHAPITAYVRAGEASHPMLGLSIAGFLGWLLGHFSRE